MIGVTVLPQVESREVARGSLGGPFRAVRVGEAAHPGPTEVLRAWLPQSDSETKVASVAVQPVGPRMTREVAEAVIARAHSSREELSRQLRRTDPELKDEEKLKLSFEEGPAPSDCPEAARRAKAKERQSARERKDKSSKAFKQSGPREKTAVNRPKQATKAEHEHELGPEPEGPADEEALRARRGRRLQSHRGSRGGSRRKRRVKEGKEEKEGGDREVSIFFANITNWSEHAAHYLRKLEDQFILTAETHLAKEEGEKLLKSKAMGGWHGTAGPAALTGRSEKGTHGGCLALARKCIDTVPLATCEGPEGTSLSRADLAGRILRTQGGA